MRKVKPTFSPSSREFITVEDFADRTLLDAFADVFTAPDDLPAHQTDYGFMARIRDAHRIRGDFSRALRSFEKETAKKPHRSSE